MAAIIISKQIAIYRVKLCRKLIYFDLPLIIQHNLRLTLVIIDGIGHTNRLALQVLLRLVGEAATFIEHDHGRKWVVRVFTSHVQKGRSVVQNLCAVHFTAHRDRFANVSSRLIWGDGACGGKCFATTSRTQQLKNRYLPLSCNYQCCLSETLLCNMAISFWIFL